MDKVDQKLTKLPNTNNNQKLTKYYLWQKLRKYTINRQKNTQKTPKIDKPTQICKLNSKP